MSKFITGKELEDAVYDIIWDAERTLLIVSPYIKLDDYFKDLFKKHIDNYKLQILLIFGKNEKKVHKSLSNEDFGFFKQFPNVSIVYVPDLHAKYYGNEKKGVITSINLYDYSFRENIEFGVFAEQNFLTRFSTSTSADLEAWHYCREIAEENDVVYIKRPAFRAKKGLISIGKEFVKSEVLFDSTDKFYGMGKGKSNAEKRLGDFPDTIDLDLENVERPERVWEDKSKPEKKNYQFGTDSRNFTNSPKPGYCIRTGVEIEFNPEKPLSAEAFRTWSQFEDVNYPEQYCHYSGDKSFGDTSFAKPILHKYWKKAMAK